MVEPIEAAKHLNFPVFLLQPSHAIYVQFHMYNQHRKPQERDVHIYHTYQSVQVTL